MKNQKQKEDITIKQAQEMVDDWIKTTGVSYFSELSQLAQLTEEVGEVARVISRTYGEQSFKKFDEAKKLADELADVLFTVICLANSTGIDLTKALHKNLAKKTKRDKKRHTNNVKLKMANDQKDSER
ncbi:MAG: nucleotide pyrophosphohydrolase [Candidatus Gribaldobacteria bacterium]|nr:nucleotide pyrophosphohydrolase [Candidatus Gribaldobacteria bacterium]